MTIELQCLIAEARGLANDHPCVREHAWESIGGRPCPYERCRCEERYFAGGVSQAVYQCARCGAYDYGQPGGPGWKDCHA